MKRIFRISNFDSKSTFEVWTDLKQVLEWTFLGVKCDLCRSESRALHPQPDHRRAESRFAPEVDGASRVRLHCDRRWPRLSGPQLHLPDTDTGNTHFWNCCHWAALEPSYIPQQHPLFITRAVQPPEELGKGGTYEMEGCGWTCACTNSIISSLHLTSSVPAGKLKVEVRKPQLQQEAGSELLRWAFCWRVPHCVSTHAIRNFQSRKRSTVYKLSKRRVGCFLFFSFLLWLQSFMLSVFVFLLFFFNSNVISERKITLITATWDLEKVRLDRGETGTSESNAPRWDLMRASCRQTHRCTVAGSGKCMHAHGAAQRSLAFKHNRELKFPDNRLEVTFHVAGKITCRYIVVNYASSCSEMKGMRQTAE